MIFEKSVGVALAVANNQVVIASPGAGLSIYIQTVEIVNNALAAGAISSVNLLAGVGGTLLAVPSINGAAQLFKDLTFPGGFKLPAATALIANVATNTCFMIVTYTIGPA